MTTEERYDLTIRYFERENPDPRTELHYGTPFQLLVATMLSAQCTDKRVNESTGPLFEAFPTPESMAGADFDTLFPYVRSISYPNSKTRHLLEMSRMLVSEFGGRVPDDIDSLTMLPGVGRKTASVVLSVAFNQPYMAVDTHVLRVSHRLGLSKGKTPDAVQDDLHAHIPEEIRPKAHHWLILHGRYVCTASRPKCRDCGLAGWCLEREKVDGGK